MFVNLLLGIPGAAFEELLDGTADQISYAKVFPVFAQNSTVMRLLHLQMVHDNFCMFFAL
jgi:hypothetical protein